MDEPPPISETPMRVESLEYQSPRRERRPGILTGLGIASISIASLGLVTNCGGLVSLATIPAMMALPTATTPPPAAPVQASTRPTAGPLGLTPENREIVAQALDRGRLTSQRREMLGMLIDQVGRDILPFDELQITSERLVAMVSDSGQLPGVGDKAGNDYFVLGTGRIEIGDEHAVFSPTSGSTIRVWRGEVNETAPAEPVGASNAGVIPAAAAAPTPGAAFGASLITYLWINGIYALLSLLMSIFLMICGILVLNNSPKGQRWHLIYAWSRLALVIIGTAASMIVLNQAMAASTDALGLWGGVGFMLAISLVLGCAYPLVILIILRRRSVREYYAGSTL